MCVQGNALAATIHGTVYEWYSFKPLENTVVEINSTPVQYFVATNAEYSFNLTRGTYLITANYFEENNVVYTTKEEVIVSDNGEYVHDLLLFPTYQEDLLDLENLENVDLDFEEAEPQSQANSQNTVLVPALLALCVLLLAGYFVKQRKRTSPENTAGFPENMEKPQASEPNLSESEKFTVSGETARNPELGKAGTEVLKTDYEFHGTLNANTLSGGISKSRTSCATRREASGSLKSTCYFLINSLT